MKRTLLLACLVFGMISMTACGHNQITSTTTHITVTEKGEANNEQWIIVNSGMGKQTKIYVMERNTWNLIEIGKEYFSDYDTEAGKSTLSVIRYPNIQ